MLLATKPLSASKHKNPVGGAVRRFDLLPIAVFQSLNRCLIHRNREQAVSHIELSV